MMPSAEQSTTVCRLPLAAALLVLALLPSGAAFGHEDRLPGSPEDLNARSLNILAYHPYPDVQGDPFGVPYGERNGTNVGFMEATYASYWFPTAVTDGTRLVEGATQFLDTYNAYEADYKARLQHDSPFRVAVDGMVMGDQASYSVNVQTKDKAPSRNLTLRIVLFEDEIPYDGGNGVKSHRFTVRQILKETPITSAETAWDVEGAFMVEPDWDAARLGLVAAIVNGEPTANLEPREVVQAASYRFDQQGPTIQYSKGVLLEVYTASWCAACIYGDAAIDELANAYGLPSSRLLNQEFAYLRPWDLTAVGAAAAVGFGGSFGVFLAARGRRPT